MEGIGGAGGKCGWRGLQALDQAEPHFHSQAKGEREAATK